MGICVKANIQLNNKDTANTINKSLTYSPVVSGDIKMGKKARIAIKVAPNNGIAVFFTILTKAAGFGTPLSKST